MANTLHLSRDVKVYILWGTKYWEVPVLDGFSFSQATNTTEVTLKEFADSSASKVSRRGRKVFNDSLGPAEWSFSTYARPTIQGNFHRAPEEILWAMMVGAATAGYDHTGDSGNGEWDHQSGAGLDSDGNSLDINFLDSIKLVFPDAEIFFVFPANDAGGSDADLAYKLDKATVNECTMDFDIDGITTLNWSGMAQSLTEVSAPDVSGGIEISSTSLTKTTTFIRNRLTTLVLGANTDVSQPGLLTSYSLVLTGGSLTITNNVEHITPSSLGVVNKPLGHTMGTRSVTGSFTCYLDNSTTASAELFDDLLGATTNVKNEFSLTFNVGGTAAPCVAFTCAHAMLEIPTHSVEDVVSMEVNFHALPEDIADQDDLAIVYKGV